MVGMPLMLMLVMVMTMVVVMLAMVGVMMAADHVDDDVDDGNDDGSDAGDEAGDDEYNKMMVIILLNSHVDFIVTSTRVTILEKVHRDRCGSSTSSTEYGRGQLWHC